MRLINCHTLELEEFFTQPKPKYGILSHRWTDEEISYKDYAKNRRQGTGFQKIVRCCALAVKRGLHYVWVDTCCIDKRSSAELSEAINSMYRWYREAHECYVYLSDVEPQAAQTSDEQRAHAILQSSWWSRGWTLQELIAPSFILFLAADWVELDHKHTDISLQREVKGTTNIREWVVKNRLIRAIVARTAIPVNVLCRMNVVHRCSVAQRLSWAAQRVTTREEDQAYCLLGILDVNMPLLYGEGGTKAFLRLQEEVIRTSNDESVFAFRREPARTKRMPELAMLAQSPNQFSDCCGIVRTRPKGRPPYSLTNQGVEFRLQPNQEIYHRAKCEYFVMQLACRRADRIAWGIDDRLLPNGGRESLWICIQRRNFCGHYAVIWSDFLPTFSDAQYLTTHLDGIEAFRGGKGDTRWYPLKAGVTVWVHRFNAPDWLASCCD